MKTFLFYLIIGTIIMATTTMAIRETSPLRIITAVSSGQVSLSVQPSITDENDARTSLYKGCYGCKNVKKIPTNQTMNKTITNTTTSITVHEPEKKTTIIDIPQEDTIQKEVDVSPVQAVVFSEQVGTGDYDSSLKMTDFIFTLFISVILVIIGVIMAESGGRYYGIDLPGKP